MSSSRVRSDNISVFAPHGDEEVRQKAGNAREKMGGRTGFDYPTTLEGSTAHFQVYYDPSLGNNGKTVADAVLATCEQDYATLQSWFGNITPPGLPFQIVVAPLDATGGGGGGAYHWGCGAVALYCDIKTSPAVNADYTRLLVIAEEVEVFEAAQGLGFNCGASNGEGLSRVLAEALYPNGIIPWMYSAPTWLDSATRPDYVSINDPTDRNYLSTGCSVMFLYYMHSQLGYSWAKITQAAGTTLEATYHSATGKTGGYTALTTLLQSFYPIGKPSGLKTDNPFPLKHFIKEHKEFKEPKEIKEIAKEVVKEHKEIKEPKEFKEHKEPKEFKEHKEFKEYKEFKEPKEFKEGKEIKEKDKDVEGPPGGPPPELGADTEIIQRILERLDELEKKVASGKAFITAEERPKVGAKVMKGEESKDQ